jgi:hypothetical protein
VLSLGPLAAQSREDPVRRRRGGHGIGQANRLTRMGGGVWLWDIRRVLDQMEVHQRGPSDPATVLP